jgi:hypothetical protein
MVMCCVCVFSLHQESHGMILDDKPLISEVVLSHLAHLIIRSFVPIHHPLKDKVISHFPNCLQDSRGAHIIHIETLLR